ncbi:hypothetical protein EDC30_104345 [Paucimonas lemoignei]|uniref:DUF192 domain-containing protein n=1 Tax=Paucimonas lemoignei TaxID=29443 RepID=A0A4R3HYY7_PAULE|nr:DUF192 domain-containing protein [Paucimonas lemoignei]TCS37541.1 hypothetical protein EDC30_104345 [Paucimonas lemoignei]
MRLGAIYRGEECLLPRVWDAVSAWERTRGLLGRPQLKTGEGMLIRKCGMVHTLGMGYALDLAFIDKAGRVRKLVRGLAPARMAGSLAACATLEMAPGTLDAIGLHPGDHLDWREVAA